MKVHEAEFVVSAYSAREFPSEEIPEIVFAGRSNVGKSSLLNRLVERKRLARTSSTPGKTQSINFYRINGWFFLVDLPGYGFAKVAKSASRHWKELVESYFVDRPSIALVLHLVDSRVPPSVLDLELAEWLHHWGIPSVVIGTKADKLSGNEQAVQRRVLSTTFSGSHVTLASALTGFGCGEIWKRVLDATRRN